jgi:hypothetical protein
LLDPEDGNITLLQNVGKYLVVDSVTFLKILIARDVLTE